jgi:hypothetical protein
MKTKSIIIAGILGAAMSSQAATIFTESFTLGAGMATGSGTDTHTYSTTIIVDGSDASFDLVVTAVGSDTWTGALGSLGITGGASSTLMDPGESGAFSVTLDNWDAGTSAFVEADVDFGFGSQYMHNNAKGGTDSGTFTLLNGAAPSSTLTCIDSNGGSDFTGHTTSFDLSIMNDTYGSVGVGDAVTSFTHVAAGAAWSFSSVTVEYSVVPEPGTYALLGGLLALGAVMVRRRR